VANMSRMKIENGKQGSYEGDSKVVCSKGARFRLTGIRE